MADQRPGLARWLSSLIVLGLLVAMGIASACLWYFGDWEQHSWGLTLTLRILWGVWVVIALATILTRVTLFGWSFRQYARWAGEQMPAWSRLRPAKAPWTKSGKASFSFTMIMVLVTGGVAIATAVMWILIDVTHEEVFWLVFKIVWGSWWVVMIGLVLARVAVFGVAKQKAMLEAKKAERSLVGSESSESQS